MSSPIDFSPLPNEAELQARAARFRDLRVLGLELGLVAAVLGLSAALDFDLPHRPLAISGSVAAAAGIFALQGLDRRLYVRGYVLEDRLRLILLSVMVVGGAALVWWTARSALATGAMLGAAIALVVFVCSVKGPAPAEAVVDVARVGLVVTRGRSAAARRATEFR
jgi:uncharacterized membrane protein